MVSGRAIAATAGTGAARLLSSRALSCRRPGASRSSHRTIIRAPAASAISRCASPRTCSGADSSARSFPARRPSPIRRGPTCPSRAWRVPPRWSSPTASGAGSKRTRRRTSCSSTRPRCSAPGGSEARRRSGWRMQPGEWARMSSSSRTSCSSPGASGRTLPWALRSCTCNWQRSSASPTGSSSRLSGGRRRSAGWPGRSGAVMTSV